MAMIALFGVGLGALSYALAVASPRAQDWIFWTVQQTLLFPLLLLSGILLPIDDARGGCRRSRTLNPLTYVVAPSGRCSTASSAIRPWPPAPSRRSCWPPWA